MVVEAAYRKSRAKSRSPDASMLFRVIVVETELAGNACAVEWKTASRQRTRAERHHVDATPGILKPLPIARRTFRNKQGCNAPTAPAARGACACNPE